DLIVEKLHIAHHENAPPLFNIMIVYENGDMSNARLNLQGILCESLDIGEPAPKYPVVFYIRESEMKTTIDIEYLLSKYKHDTIADLMKQYVIILESMTNSMDIRINDLSLSPVS